MHFATDFWPKALLNNMCSSQNKYRLYKMLLEVMPKQWIFSGAQQSRFSNTAAGALLSFSQGAHMEFNMLKHFEYPNCFPWVTSVWLLTRQAYENLQ